MTFDVNSQIIDSINSTTAHTVGHSSAESQGLLDTLMAETIGMAMYNAVTSQHNAQMVSTASVTAACARMLKIPSMISPATPIAQPVITSITSKATGGSDCIYAEPGDQTIEIAGHHFPTDPTISIFDSKFNKLAVLNGAAQVTKSSPTACTIVTNAFTAAQVYNISVGNDLMNSIPFQVTAVVPAPQIMNVQNLDGKLVVTGHHFQPGVSFNLKDDQKRQVETTGTEHVSASRAHVALAQINAAGAYEIQAVNPDGTASAPRLFVLQPAPTVSLNLTMTPLTDVDPCSSGQSS
jgi:hypothetical protein